MRLEREVFKAVIPEIQVFAGQDLCSFTMRKLKAYHSETYFHSIRTAGVCSLIYDALGLDPVYKPLMLRSALLHDIGKLAIRRELLDKQGFLTQEEWAELKSHGWKGLDILGQIGLRIHVRDDMILFHHENLDGTGHEGLFGNELSIATKILRTADSFDIMAFGRAGAEAASLEEAFKELYRWRNIHYESAVVEALYGLAKSRQGKDGADHGIQTVGE